MDPVYKENILYHYKNPQNTGKLGNPTHKSTLANYSCGDEINLELEIERNKIKSIAHETRGCAISIASASILSEYMQGKSKKEIMQFDSDDLMELLGIELTPSRLKCALLALEAIKKALKAGENLEN